MLSAEDLNSMQQIAPFRSHRLFQEFLPQGYAMTTLSSVEDRDEVVGLKVLLGTIITLYDDFADRPDRMNPRLLQLLYRLPFEAVDFHEAFLSREEKEAFYLARVLFGKLQDGISFLPNHDRLVTLFNFDLRQFFLANQYSEILTATPQVANRLENRLYLHHNMGIVMAGMIDLMSLENLKMNELGNARSLFLLGQRAGRISNVLTTFEREQEEEDKTSELLTSSMSNLEEELADLSFRMKKFEVLESFSVNKYIQGIEELHELHLSLKGVI